MNDFESKLNRLIAAAVISRDFRQMLLVNPAKGVQGYGNEAFNFTPTERELIEKIRATTLEDFANQVYQLIGKTQDPGSTKG